MSKYFPDSQARNYNPSVDLTPWAVEQYLLLSEWRLIERRGSDFAIWGTADQRASLMLPYDSTFGDFSLRFREALRAIAEVVELEGEALALEIVSARKDIFLVRADQDTADGSIPFVEARNLITGVEKLLTTAAASAIRPRASTAGRKSGVVREFLEDDVRMGHTMRGSFVITVLAADSVEDGKRQAEWERALASAPTGVSIPVPLKEPDDVTFSRQVMTNLATGLEAAQDILSNPVTERRLEGAVELGLTAQMLEAVTSMSSSEGVQGLDMSFRWSRLDRQPSDVPKAVRLDRDDAQSAKPVIEKLRRAPEVTEDQVVGEVWRLERSQGSSDGLVIIDGTVGKSRRRVRVPLSGSAYQRAIAAHDSHAMVKVVGTFLPKSRGWEMQPNATLTLI